MLSHVLSHVVLGPLSDVTHLTGVKVLSGNFKGARPPRGFGRDPGKNVKGDNSWCSTRNPILIH